MLRQVLARLSSVLSDLSFVVLLVLFLGMDAVGFSRWLDAAVASHPEVVGALRAFARGTRGCVVVSTVFGLIGAVGDALALFWLGVPLPLLLGLLSFVTKLRPQHRLRPGPGPAGAAGAARGRRRGPGRESLMAATA